MFPINKLSTTNPSSYSYLCFYYANPILSYAFFKLNKLHFNFNSHYCYHYYHFLNTLIWVDFYLMITININVILLHTLVLVIPLFELLIYYYVAG